MVLVEPEIPQNTGNVSRTCVLTNSVLHLVGPLGFSIDDRQLKRAGLDYWQYLRLEVYNGWQEFLARNSQGNLILFSTRGTEFYADYTYCADDYLIFGCETRGLPDCCFQTEGVGRVLRIPMKSSIKRSLNLSNSVAIVVYEAMRQLDFPDMN